MTKEIIIVVLGGLFSASTVGNVLMYWIKKRDRLARVEAVIEHLAEGMTLGLQNDIVIFNALRNNHINGESEAQEQKMTEYFYKNTNEGLRL